MATNTVTPTTDTTTPAPTPTAPTKSEDADVVAAQPPVTHDVKINGIRIDCVDCGWMMIPTEVVGYYKGQNPECKCNDFIVQLPETLTLTVIQGK